MKKALYFITAIAVSFAFAACNDQNAPSSTDEGNNGEGGNNAGAGITFKIDPKNSTLTISGEGPMKDYQSADEPEWNKYAEIISTVIVERGVTTIGQYAFAGCPNLQTVELPYDLDTIKAYAFYQLEYLQEISIPYTVRAIMDRAFNGCKALKSCTFDTGGKLTYLGLEVFQDCESLQKIDLPSYLNTMGNNCFQNCFELDSANLERTKLNAIPRHAFDSCKKLTTVILPSILKSIEASAFSSCENLVMIRISGTKQITFPSQQFKTIGKRAFYGCKALPYLNFPSSLTTLGDEAFYNCESLTSVDLGFCAISTFGTSVFVGCNKLENVSWSSSTTIVPDFTFYKCASLTTVSSFYKVKTIGKSAFLECTNLKNIELPSALVEVGAWAFFNCKLLPAIKLPSSCTTLGRNAFDGCNAASLDMTQCTKLITIPEGAFYGVAYNRSDINTLVIPACVQTIGKNAFRNFVNNRTLKVTCKASTPPDIYYDSNTNDNGESAFNINYKSSRDLYVPSSSVEKYKDSNWGKLFYTTHIYAL